MIPDRDSRAQLPWPQLAILFGVFAVLLVILLVGGLRRPAAITPQNAPGLREVLRLDFEAGHGIRQMRLSDDGQMLVAAVWHVDYVWRFSEGTRQTLDLSHLPGSTSHVFFRDETPLATYIDQTGPMSVFDIDSGQRLLVFENAYFSGGVTWAISPDGHTIVITTQEALSIYDTMTGARHISVPVEQGRIFAASRPRFSSDGRLIAASTMISDCGCDLQVLVWEAATGTEVARPGALAGSLRIFEFSDDDRWLAAGGSDNLTPTAYLQLWDVESGELLGSRALPDGIAVQQIAISPNRQFIGAAGHGNVWLWDMEDFMATKPPMIELTGSYNRGFGPTAFSPDSQLFAYGTPNSRIQLVDTSSGAQVAELRGHSQRIRHLLFHPDGRLLISSGGDRTIRLWGLETVDIHLRDTDSITQPALSITPTVPGG